MTNYLPWLTRDRKKNTTQIIASFLILGCVYAGEATAQENPWTLRAGPVGVFWDVSTKASVAGAPVPGADVAVKDNYSLGFDVGYDLSNRWTMHFAFGVPPTAKLHTAGSLNAMVPPLSGQLGKVKYGPAVLSAVYKFDSIHGIVPYAGAGVTFVHVFKTSDGDVQRLDVDDAWGGALQVGFTVPLKEHWSLFFDVRKLFVKTKARGAIPALGGPPASVSLKLDPLIVHTGLEYRF